jgi:NADH-quinone oxidoreductase subunit H
MMFFFMPVLTVLLFFGPVEAAVLSILAFILKLLLVLVILITIKITHARLRLDQALSFFWYRVSVIGLAAVLLAFLGL